MPGPLLSGSAGQPWSAHALGNARQRARLGHSRRVTLDDDVRVADRYRDRTPRVAREVALRRRRSWQIIRSWVVHDDVLD
jgi:hypothetical protein